MSSNYVQKKAHVEVVAKDTIEPGLGYERQSECIRRMYQKLYAPEPEAMHLQLSYTLTVH